MFDVISLYGWGRHFEISLLDLSIPSYMKKNQAPLQSAVEHCTQHYVTLAVGRVYFLNFTDRLTGF